VSGLGLLDNSGVIGSKINPGDVSKHTQLENSFLTSKDKREDVLLAKRRLMAQTEEPTPIKVSRKGLPTIFNLQMSDELIDSSATPMTTKMANQSRELAQSK